MTEYMIQDFGAVGDCWMAEHGRRVVLDLAGWRRLLLRGV